MFTRHMGVLILSISAFIIFIAGCVENRDESPFYTIGVVTNNRNGMANIEGFKSAMTDYGYVEGKNVSYIDNGSPIDGQNLKAFLDSMVESKVDLIFTAGTPTGIAAHKSTADSSIPVIFGVIADPVSANVVKNLTTPGGNLTGIMLSDNQDRRFELLVELAPHIKTVFVPFNPDDAAPISAIGQIRNLAPKLGVELIEAYARNSSQAQELILSIPKTADAIFMLPDSTVNEFISELVAVAIERKLPISGPSMMQLEDGALTAYGIIHRRVGGQAARIANQVLQGADPAKVPVETAEVYLGINLKTAETIGISVPLDVIQQAEIIIRPETRN